MISAQLKKHLFRAVLILVPLLIGYTIYSSWYESTDDAFLDADLVPMSARVAGHVQQVSVQLNQRVDAGQVLLVIDPAEFQARVDQATAEWQLAQAEQTRAASDLRRYSTLAQHNEIAQQRLTHAQADADAARAKVAAALARKTAAELQLSYTRITAPFAGRVTQCAVQPGWYVHVGQPLFSIVSDNVWVIANFKETQIAQMQPGEPASIHIDALGLTLRGHVDSLQAGSGARFSLFPPENATGNFVKVVQRVPVKIVFDEQPDILKTVGPGMSVVPTVTVR